MQTTPTSPSGRGLSRYDTKLVRHKSRQVIGKASISTDEAPDVEQDLALNLMQGLGRYDPAKASKKTFASRLVRNHLSKILRGRLALKRGLLVQTESLNELVDDGDGGLIERSQTIPDERVRELASLRAEVAEVLERLPPRLRAVCDALSRQSTSDAARSLGIHRCTLYARIAEIRHAFLGAGFERPKTRPRNRSRPDRVRKQ